MKKNVSMPVEKKEKKFEDCTPEEQAEIKRKRGVFKNLHDFFGKDTSYEAEGQLGVLQGAIMTSIEELQARVKMSDLKFEKPDEKFAKAIDLLRNESILDARTFVQALANAITHGRYAKTKDFTLNDLDITLYE